jgi:hypothetical protein
LPAETVVSRYTDNMDAFKGKYERTSADNYEELLKVGLSLFFIIIFGFCS